MRTAGTDRLNWLALALAVAGLLPLRMAAAETPTAASEAAAADDETGYFLSLRQKGQLIGKGRIQDAAGRWYDVWICPGYADPSRYAWEHIRKSGRHFAEYGKPDKYRKAGRQSKDALKWGFDDCINDFVIEGVPKAWRRYMDTAAERTRRRVFGSVVAYPWATMEGIFNTTFRTVGGLGGMLVGTTAGLVCVPVWNALDSGVAGTGVFVAQGVAVPVSGYTWNTLISPPLALVGGPQPSPGRADGFWVRVVDPRGRPRDRLCDGELSAVVAWGVLLLTEVQPYLDRAQALAKDTGEKVAALQQEASREQRRLTDEAGRRAAQFRDAAGPEAVPLALKGGVADQVASALRRDASISEDDVQKILRLLNQYPPAVVSPPAPTLRPKTDPLRRGTEILKEVGP